MSEEDRGMRGLIGGWFEFESFRKTIESKIHELELSNFNATYGPKSEVGFRSRLKEIRILLDKIETLLGPAKETSTLVS